MSDRSLDRLARGSGLNIVGAVCQQGCLVLTTAVIARVLGSDALGRYALTYGILTVLGLLVLFGFRASLTRFIATQLADGDPGAVRGTVRLCLSISVVASVCVSVVLLGTATQVAGLFHDDGLVGAVRCVAITLPAATVRDAALAATQGWRSQRAFTLIGWIFEPVLRLALTAAALALSFGVGGAYFALSFGAWAAAILAVRALLLRMRTVEPARAQADTRSIMLFAVASWGTTLASTGLIWADTLIIGYYRSAGEVGVYNVATRLVGLAVFVMAPINAAFAPQFAHHFHTGERSAAAQSYAATTNWIVRLSLPAFVALVVFPDPLLRIFGGAFAAGATVTMVLAVGQLVNAATGPCGTALNMAGRVNLNVVNNVVVLVLNVALNVVLIPRYGIVGAAWAWTASLVLVNLARLVQVRMVAGITPFGAATAKAIAAAAAAAALAVAVRLLAHPWPVQLAIGVVAIVGGYVAVSVLLGFDPGERRAARALVRPAAADRPAGAARR